MGSRDALSELDWNYLQAQRIFMASSERGEYLERRDAAIVCCGLPTESLNFGFLKPPYADVVATAETVRDYFVARELPFKVQLRGAEARARARALEARGWHAQPDPTPGMTLALDATPPPVPIGLVIQEVRGTDELVAFRDVAFQSFGYPLAAAPLFLTERFLGLPGVRLFAGRRDGRVVATSMLVATGAVAGIYWVGTLEAERGRGYGQALTWAAAAAGREQGCRVASLQASKLGRPVYAAMGFSHVLDYESLLPPPGTPASLP